MGPEVAIMAMAALGAVMCISLVLVRFLVIRARLIERKALIERGWMPSQSAESFKEARLMSKLKWMRNAYLIIGLALGGLTGGVISAFLQEVFRLHGPTPVLMVFIMMALGAGASIILYYRMEPDYLEVEIDPEKEIESMLFADEA
ncbi:MAG: hypothetical protein AAF399_14755 [Bacteroidota bacterium]